MPGLVNTHMGQFAFCVEGGPIWVAFQKLGQFSFGPELGQCASCVGSGSIYVLSASWANFCLVWELGQVRPLAELGQFTSCVGLFVRIVFCAGVGSICLPRAKGTIERSYEIVFSSQSSLCASSQILWLRINMHTHSHMRVCTICVLIYYRCLQAWVNLRFPPTINAITQLYPQSPFIPRGMLTRIIT